jgi:hypothetical protein
MQAVRVDFQEHIRWALEYFDHRFRRHETFPFVAFGIVQHREALGLARIQMRRQNFERDAHIMSSISQEKLEEARQEEENHKPIADPAIRLLWKHIHAISGHVMGSDQSRYQLRSQIWSTTLYLGPPSLWITINPSDIHDPIAQVFAGETIDLDNFVWMNGPDKDKRAQNIAADPYVASKFFHFIIGTILETLFQIRISSHQVKTQMGLMGLVSAYFGVVELQGRGTLHLHLLLWLMNTPSAKQMEKLLEEEEFRSKIIAYIKANLRAYLPGLESAESIKQIPIEKDIAYNRPPNPDSLEFKDEIRAFELWVCYEYSLFIYFFPLCHVF